MPIAFEIIMPSVVPIQTVQTARYSTAREIVASCVLSPISAMKKATVTVQKGLKWKRSSSPSSRSPRIVQRPKTMKEMAALNLCRRVMSVRTPPAQAVGPGNRRQGPQSNRSLRKERFPCLP